MTKKYETCGKVRVGVAPDNKGVWYWRVEVDMGEVMIDDQHPGTRLAQPGEDVPPEWKVWRTLASGKEPTETFAWIAAGGVVVGLSLVATTLVGQVAAHAGGASDFMRQVIKDMTPQILGEVEP